MESVDKKLQVLIMSLGLRVSGTTGVEAVTVAICHELKNLYTQVCLETAALAAAKE